MENQMQNNQQKNSFFQSATAKMIMVGLLTLILLIPLTYVQDLIQERSQRKKEVVAEVSDLWGKDVYFYGPTLKIPYKEQTTGSVINAYFFPEKLNNKSFIKKNNSLKRGIYNNVVFTANMDFDGYFAKPNFEKLGISESQVIWDKATIIIKTTNLKSIKSDLNIKLNNQSFEFESKTDEENTYATLETSLFNYTTLVNQEKINFNFNMKYNGSNSVKFIPIGKRTAVSIDSDWESPSFEGAFAANDVSKKIDEKGFHADWKVLDINRSFSQQFTNKLPNLNDYTFGVKLIETVDEYQQNERASKYGFLVIGLFFLIQSISKINIHIFQYSMIGLALIMFYTLLISITEHSSFKLAYLITGLSVIVMISIYSLSILENRKFSIFISLSLTALYSFIYVIIQLENYALLVGSIGLFAILGAVMYFSRKIDWK
jgi:inner membrane protein